MRQADSEFTEESFIGFVPPTSNYFKMPNEWIDITAHIDNLAELKVVQYVLRHTWGFHEYAGEYKHITIDEFVAGRKRRDDTRMDSGTGLCRRAVQEGLDRAIAHGFLEVEVDESDKGRVRKSYRLKMMHLEEKSITGSTHATDELGVHNMHLQVQNMHLQVQNMPFRGAQYAPRTSKDTTKSAR